MARRLFWTGTRLSPEWYLSDATTSTNISASVLFFLAEDKVRASTNLHTMLEKQDHKTSDNFIITYPFILLS